jgi:hypothetical protein
MKTRTTLILTLAIVCIPLWTECAAAQTQSTPQRSAVGPGHDDEADAKVSAAHEYALAALRAERRKLKAGKSTYYFVHDFASRLRDVELQMSNNATQRIAAFARHASAMRELEEDAVNQVEADTLAAKEADAVRQWRVSADEDLLRAKVEGQRDGVERACH